MTLGLAAVTAARPSLWPVMVTVVPAAPKVGRSGSPFPRGGRAQYTTSPSCHIARICADMPVVTAGNGGLRVDETEGRAEGCSIVSEGVGMRVKCLFVTTALTAAALLGAAGVTGFSTAASAAVNPAAAETV